MLRNANHNNKAMAGSFFTSSSTRGLLFFLLSCQQPGFLSIEPGFLAIVPAERGRDIALESIVKLIASEIDRFSYIAAFYLRFWGAPNPTLPRSADYPGY